ncbi:hypothetical protein CBM2604_A140102 [Cupriavidus taiwanensis]|nr:hypothetical protein CBM2604_A140102 [Cupriavidus taiwanensis]
MLMTTTNLPPPRLSNRRMRRH